MVETDIQRYNRQELIDGWDQSKLKNATVTIVGSGPIGQQTALPLAALGVGNIRIIDTAKGEENDQLLDLSLRGDARVKSLEEKLQIINPEVKVRGIVSEMTTLGAQYFLANSNVIIDATNDPRSKVCVLDYVTKKRSRFISASGNSYEGKVVY
ncbi:MAG: ThiF family adenylyltransferase, partial [Nanoarchaeota archaeon]|nr:ThiF family adenylyltransferase [Nanoarchaeota archaeon]